MEVIRIDDSAIKRLKRKIIILVIFKNTKYDRSANGKLD